MEIIIQRNRKYTVASWNRSRSFTIIRNMIGRKNTINISISRRSDLAQYVKTLDIKNYSYMFLWSALFLNQLKDLKADYPSCFKAMIRVKWPIDKLKFVTSQDLAWSEYALTWVLIRRWRKIQISDAKVWNKNVLNRARD